MQQKLHADPGIESGQERMRWLGIDDQHHELSHNDSADSKEQLTKIDGWFAEQVAYLAKRLLYDSANRWK